jgi:glyoxylase-like metal-dependent hydrolase (beta-lactamase superfamily II)
MSTSITARSVAPDTEALTVHFPVPGLGVLPINSFVIRSAEPVLVDAGLAADSDLFLDGLRSAIDLGDVRWIWLTHTDADHVGCLLPLLDAAPRARVVTTFLGLGKLGLRRPVPPERAYLLNPGQALDVGDRSLVALTPPSFDAPETTGLFDSRTRCLFSADCFGALLPEPAELAAALPASTLEKGLVTWATVDAPWLPWIRDRDFERAASAVLKLDPSVVLSSHLPPARGLTRDLIRHLDRARSVPPFVGPDQEALVASLRSA